MSAPLRLSGRRCQAIRPQAANEPPRKRKATCQAGERRAVREDHRHEDAELGRGGGGPQRAQNAAGRSASPNRLRARALRRSTGLASRVPETASLDATRIIHRSSLRQADEAGPGPLDSIRPFRAVQDLGGAVARDRG